MLTGNWKDQFKPERTRKGQFFINDKDTVEVDMMFQEEKFALGYSKELGVQVIVCVWAPDKSLYKNIVHVL